MILPRLRKAFEAEKRCQEARDIQGFIAAQGQFRSALRKGASNARLAQIELLDDQITQQRLLTQPVAENRASTLVAHACIIEAAEVGDPVAGEAAMARLMPFAKEYLDVCG